MQSFLQSREWEEIQRRVGRKTWRLRGVLFILHEFPFGFSYLYCPRPNPAAFSGNAGLHLLREADSLAKNEKALFLKIDPLQRVRLIPPSEDNRTLAFGLSERRRNIVPSYIRPEWKTYEATSLQPQQTIIIPLNQSREELLGAMHQKTRYNIKLSEKHGVRVAMYTGLHEKKAKFPIFFNLLRETARREKFFIHEERYYQTLLEVQSNEFENDLFLAYYKEEPVAAALVNVYQKTAVYLHGASSKKYRHIMAPYLLHWNIIEEAKRRGCETYDLWGVDQKKWPGLTRFKKGFGGRDVLHPESVHIVYRPFWHYLYQLKQKFL